MGGSIRKDIAVIGITLLLSTAQHATAQQAAAQHTTSIAAALEGEAGREPLTDRERTLLQRIEDLERRLAVLESRLTPAAPSLVSAQTGPGGLDDAAAHPSAPTAAQANAQEPVTADAEGVKIVPHAVLVASAAYNTHPLVSGSIGFFGLPTLGRLSGEQFSVSAGNTLVGADIVGPRVRGWAINGKFDFNLRGPTPVSDPNVFAPFFANVYVEARTDRHRVMAGQGADVVSPLSPRSLNLYPGSYLPGDLGTARPQFRYEYRYAPGDATALQFQGALATAVQTFQVSDEVVGIGTDVPDGQLRVAIGVGTTDPRDGRKPFELGVSGHVGRRRGVLVSALFERDFTTWSGNVDLSIKLGGRTTVAGEWFVGSILGDYKGGILHTFNPIRGIGVRAKGGWAQLQYRLTPRLSAAGGYSIDDTFDGDLSAGFRSRNDAVQGNLFYGVGPRLQVAVEVSRWRTRWVGLSDGRVLRFEPALIYVF